MNSIIYFLHYLIYKNIRGHRYFTDISISIEISQYQCQSLDKKVLNTRMLNKIKCYENEEKKLVG